MDIYHKELALAIMEAKSHDLPSEDLRAKSTEAVSPSPRAEDGIVPQ